MLKALDCCAIFACIFDVVFHIQNQWKSTLNTHTYHKSGATCIEPTKKNETNETKLLNGKWIKQNKQIAKSYDHAIDMHTYAVYIHIKYKPFEQI